MQNPSIMPDSLSNRPHQLLVAPRSCTRFAVRCDIRTDQKIRARDGALFEWQDAPRAPHVSNLIALGVSLRMTIKTVREIGEIPAASQALRRTCEMRRSGPRSRCYLQEYPKEKDHGGRGEPRETHV